jgi:hypothetical protein
MKSIRRLGYAAVLTLSALNFAPSLASAQDAAGTFTLPHEVHWQNAVVPAGNYHFTIASSGPSEMLTLRKIGGSGAGFMMLVADHRRLQTFGCQRARYGSEINRKLCQHDAASPVRSDIALRGASRNSGSGANRCNLDHIRRPLVRHFQTRGQISLSAPGPSFATVVLSKRS